VVVGAESGADITICTEGVQYPGKTLGHPNSCNRIFLEGKNTGLFEKRETKKEQERLRQVKECTKLRMVGSTSVQLKWDIGWKKEKGK